MSFVSWIHTKLGLKFDIWMIPNYEKKFLIEMIYHSKL